jgi:hypothetical protein
MLLLEDKSHITKLNELSPEQQRKLVISVTKEGGCKVYFEVIKKKMTDRKNFHILTDKENSLLRQEFQSYWEPKVHILWSVRAKNWNKRLYADFGTVIDTFNKLEE